MVVKREPMRPTKSAELWVVYQMTVNKKHVPVNAVCEQGEWDEMERLRPGHHVLVRAGITSETEAEKLARTLPVPAVVPLP